MLAIVAASEMFLAAHPADFAEFSASDWRLAKRALTGDARDAQVLCFGSSLLKFGLVPELIERRTGLTTFNLSLMGGQAASSYFLLRDALEAGARPAVVLLDCQDLPSKPWLPDVRGLGLEAHVRSWPELLSVAQSAELAWTARDPAFFGTVVARKLLTSFKARREVKSNLGQLLRKGDTSSRRQFRAQERNWALNRGTLLMGRRPRNSTAIGPGRMREPTEEWSPDPVSLEYLRRFLALAAENGMEVVWVIAPTSPEHEGLRVKTGQHAYYTKLAEDLQREFPGMTVLDGRAPGYGRGVFIDDSHLDRVGATAFTSDVAEVLAGKLGGRKPAVQWVALPPFRERIRPAGKEDMDESRLALGSKKGGARR
jgi:hypothetical protein